MKFFKYIFIVLVVFSFVSCIPNKNLVYLQNNGSENESIEVLASNSKPYRLQTNDILSISIKALDQRLVEMFSPSSLGGQQQNSPTALYFNGFTVDDHGNIRIPVLGDVNVMGYTTEEVRGVLEKRLLDEYFKSEARLFVNVKLAGLKYTMNGEIGSPGTNFLYQDKANIMEAIANSGDIAFTGDRKNVQVIRKLPQGYQTYTIDLTDAKAFNSPVFNIQPNDYIYVKPLRQKSWGTGTTGLQSFSAIISAITLIATTFLLTKTLK
jgi:polysaccharide biosynthesis/export protein